MSTGKIRYWQAALIYYGAASNWWRNGLFYGALFGLAVGALLFGHLGFWPNALAVAVITGDILVALLVRLAINDEQKENTWYARHAETEQS